MAEVPSFTRKLDWAEQHLVKIESVVTAFVNSHPYMATYAIEHKKKPTWRLHFTATPDDRLPLIVGDVLHNVRASLDYLVGALVPSSEREAT